MDAKISIDRLMNILQDFVADHEKAENNPLKKHPKLQKQVGKAIKIFPAAKPFLKGADHDFDKALLSGGSVNDLMNTVPILRAVYSAEDDADTFVISKYSELIQEKKDNDTSNRIWEYFCFCFCCCCCCCQFVNVDVTEVPKYFYRRLLLGQKLESFYSSNVFDRKMKKLDDEIKLLQDTKGARTNLAIENNNNTRLLSSQNDRDGLSRSQHWERISDFRLEEESQVVGLQHHINDLVLRLIPQQHYDDDLSTQVIAVVGEGGSGKTTLSRIVYNRIDVKRHFIIRAWVRISSVHNAGDVLACILEQVNPVKLVDRTLNEVTLMQRLIKLLNGTRFLIVLEDVDLLQVWKLLVRTVSSSCKNGKIIITTCNAEDLTIGNAEDLPPIAAYSTLCRLNDDESWKLFSIKVRIAEDELHNSELIRLKEQILRTCGGLPSIIVLLGGLLSTKEKTYDEWSRVLIKLADKTDGDHVLALSYQDLPSEVKPCFLYMGLFPKGFEIPIRRLIHLWCAEGFMTPPNSEKIDPEDVAEMCLKELITRNMVEVRWRIDGSPKTCCMPSFLYDFFCSKAANVGFLHHHFPSSHTISKQQNATIRRLGAYMGIDHFPSSFDDHCVQNIRSYVAFDSRVRVTRAVAFDIFIRRIISKRGFGLLRLLDLEGAYRPFISSSYPECSLVLLRYLSLRSTFIDYLPGWVADMPYLETLDVKHTFVTFIRLEKTNKLRHIYLNSTYDPQTVPFLSNSNDQLRTLWGLVISDFCRPATAAFRMKSLTKLRLCTEGKSQEIPEWIDELTTLQSLKLEVSSDNNNYSAENPDISLRSMAKHHRLQEVYLLAGPSPLKIDVGFLPPNLRKLTLSLSHLKEDPMPVLGQLPCLHILRLLSSSYIGERMTCRSNGFPKLNQLKLWNLSVQVWTVEEGALPCLRELEIRSCHQLNLPQGLQNVTTLKELILTNMTEVFEAAVEDNFRGRDVYIRNIKGASDLFRR